MEYVYVKLPIHKREARERMEPCPRCANCHSCNTRSPIRFAATERHLTDAAYNLAKERGDLVSSVKVSGVENGLRVVRVEPTLDPQYRMAVVQVPVLALNGGSAT